MSPAIKDGMPFLSIKRHEFDLANSLALFRKRAIRYHDTLTATVVQLARNNLLNGSVPNRVSVTLCLDGDTSPLTSQHKIPPDPRTPSSIPHDTLAFQTLLLRTSQMALL